jgi:hypothetical protein
MALNSPLVTSFYYNRFLAHVGQLLMQGQYQYMLMALVIGLMGRIMRETELLQKYSSKLKSCTRVCSTAGVMSSLV